MKSFRLKVLQLSPKNCSPALMSNSPQSVLPPTSNAMKSRITLVLDIDETLVHSSYEKKPNMTYDLTLVVQHEGQSHTVYVRYRPFLSEFLAFVGDRFEVVIFTASVSPYCHALMDKLDPRRKLGSLRLCREHCTMRQKSFIKDLFLLGRDLSRIAIIDNSPTAYLFQQRNAIPITSWFDDPADQELIKLFPMLAKLAECTSVYDVLDQFNALGVAKDE